MYTNLVTSALGLSRRRAEELRAAGLDHVQVSIQADEPAISDRIAGTAVFARKVEAATLVKELGWPLTLNVVLHRQNIDRIGAVLRLAEELGADRVELANTQYYGWAWRNRDALLPSRSQLEQAEEVVSAARTRLKGRMDVIYVLPDYYSRYPKPCMGGWANAPAHRGAERRRPALPGRPDRCPSRARACARTRWRRIWTESPLFQALPGHGLDAGAVPQLRPPARSTSGDAVARRSCSPATRRAPIRSATCPPTTASSRRRCGPRTTGRVSSPSYPDHTG